MRLFGSTQPRVIKQFTLFTGLLTRKGSTPSSAHKSLVLRLALYMPRTLRVSLKCTLLGKIERY